MEWTGVNPLFCTDQPSVEATALKTGKSGYVVLVNHGAEAHAVAVTSSAPVHSLRLITVQGPQAISASGVTWKMNLAAHDAAVLEWK